MDPSADLVATRALAQEKSATAPRVEQLLVVDANSSRMVALPSEGALLIGRGDEADVRIEDNAASRRHARIIVSPQEVRIADLESRNGTRVNGQPVLGATILAPGDVVTIGDAAIILRGRNRATPLRVLLDAAGLHRRLEEELARAEGGEDAFAVLALVLPPEVDDFPLTAALAPHLRIMDAAARPGPAEAIVVLPGLDAEAAAPIAISLLAALQAKAIEARAGIASHPADGGDADTLLAAARSLAGRAAAGSLADSQSAARVSLGDRSIIVADPAMMSLFGLIRRLAPSDLPVLIRGETGAGKENAAYALHSWSPRARQPFVAINCAALPETLVESELFGSEKGAFSSSTGTKPGLLETAEGGTVFFDELGELPRSVQPKLLRAIETKKIMRLGGTRERTLDVRFVAATNRDLEEEIRAGRFREDLLFRLNAATVVLPPLRERPSEIAILAKLFLEEACRRQGLPAKALGTAALHELCRYGWTGNVRELRNVMDFLAVTVEAPLLEAWHIRARLDPSGKTASAAAPVPAEKPSPTEKAVPDEKPAPVAPTPEKRFLPLADELRDIEKARMTEALEACGWIQTRAAELIGVPLRTFQQKVKVYGLGQRGPARG